MYSYIKERIKHVIRFRHKRGFGVHSPFMFNLILNVIRGRGKRYIYPERTKKIGITHHKTYKFYRLLFRLISYLNIKRIICLNSKPGIVLPYLSEAAPQAEIIVNQLSPLAEGDFIYIDKNARTLLSGNTFNTADLAGNCRHYMIITDIYKNSFNARLWQQLRGNATVSIDMMWYGLLIFDEKLQKGKYNLTI